MSSSSSDSEDDFDDFIDSVVSERKSLPKSSKTEQTKSDSQPNVGLAQRKAGGLLDLSSIKQKTGQKEWRARSDPIISSTPSDGSVESKNKAGERRPKLVRSISGSGKNNLRQRALGMHQAVSSQWTLTVADKLTHFPGLSSREILPFSFDIALSRLSATSQSLSYSMTSSLSSAILSVYRDLVELLKLEDKKKSGISKDNKKNKKKNKIDTSNCMDTKKLIQKIADAIEPLQSTALLATPRNSQRNSRQVNQLNVDCSCFGDQGKRSYMEDETLIIDRADMLYNLKSSSAIASFSLFDGHRGKLAALYARALLPYSILTHKQLQSEPEKAHREAYEFVNNLFNAKANQIGSKCGTTALTCFVEPMVTSFPVTNSPLRVTLSGVGDTEAVLCRDKTASCVSKKHIPKDIEEQNRIKKVGGTVEFYMGAWRVNGAISVSRSIGDPHVDKFLIPTPFFASLQIDDKDRFLILATDGIFDVISHQEAVDHVLAFIGEPKNNRAEASESLVKLALSKDAADNCSCIVVFFLDNLPGGNGNNLRSHSDVFVAHR